MNFSCISRYTESLKSRFAKYTKFFSVFCNLVFITIEVLKNNVEIY